MKRTWITAAATAVLALPGVLLADFIPYYIGSSTMDQINYTGVKQMAALGSHPYKYGRHMVPGAPLEWIWNNPKDGFRENPYAGSSTTNGYQEALPLYEWSAVVLTPTDRRLANDRDYGARFISLTRSYAANSDTTFYVFSRWPRNETTNANLPKWPSTDPYRPGELNFSAQWDRPYTNGYDNSFWTRDYYQQLTNALDADVPGADIRMIPLGDVMYKLQQRMRAGEFAAWGLRDILDIYTDASHFSNVGQYIAGTTAYATMFAEDPYGMAVPSAYAPRSLTTYPRDMTITPALASELQETIWEVVSVHPYAGVPEPTGAVVLLVGTAALSLRRRRA